MSSAQPTSYNGLNETARKHHTQIKITGEQFSDTEFADDQAIIEATEITTKITQQNQWHIEYIWHEDNCK